MLLHLPRMERYRPGEAVKNGPPLADHGAEAVREAIAKSMTTLTDKFRQSLTGDQGAAMALHAKLRIDTGLEICFCPPHSLWQRGTTKTPTACCDSIPQKVPT